MSGRLAVYNSTSGALVAERKDHQKYVVHVATFTTGSDSALLATAGWDGQILLYNILISRDGNFKISDPIARISQTTNPEALLFARDPDDNRLFLIATRRDSSFLHYYHVPEAATAFTELSAMGRQNLAPHSNAWVAFTPSSIALHPKDPTLVAVATSAVPHMKLLIVRLLFPSSDASEITYTTPPRANPTSLLEPSDTPINQQARAALALQDREAAAIIIHANTMASQTQYSSPQLVWRPDGSGVWVNSDDGAVRGVEATTGKVIANLVQGGHEVGSKIRCLYAGYVNDSDGADREVLLSGGFDQRLVHWETSP
jgi:WD40 repeat protein